ncbi:cytochrome P450 [Mycena crocata]|nr:cytochrome P450 [Mycena crocata]
MFPSVFNLWGLGALSIVITCCVYLLVPYFYDPYGIRKYPGPFLAKFSYAWILWIGITRKRSQKIHEAHEKYGINMCSPKIVSHEISFSNPAAYSDIHSFNGKVTKSNFYDAFASIGLKNVFTARSKSDHVQKRKLLHSMFTPQVTRDFTPRTSSIISQLLNEWESHYVSSQDKDVWFDCVPWISFLAFDLIGEFVFGEPFGMIPSGSDSVTVPEDWRLPMASDKSTNVENYPAHEASLTHIVSARETYNYFVGFLPPWWKPVGRRVLRKQAEAAEEFSRFVAQRLVHRLSNTIPQSKAPPDLVGRFLSKSEAENEPEALVAELITILVAGSDTTKNSLIAAIYYIGQSKTIQHDLQAELDVHMTSPLPGFADIEALPFLGACIYETLRLYSPVGIGLPRTVPQPGLRVCGEWFPCGTTVGVPIYTVHRNEALWGEHPEEFRPGRWLQDEAVGKMEGALKAFSDGPTKCIGQHLALAQLRIMIAAIFRRFDVILEHPESPLHVEDWFVRRAKECRIGLRSRLG